MLDTLLDAHAGIWRGRDTRGTAQPGLSTGWPTLDAALPGGGWPQHGVIEIQHDPGHPPPLRLLLPVCRQLGEHGRHTVLLDTPDNLVPFAPALCQHGIDLQRLIWLQSTNARDAWWVLETSLRDPACGLVLAWPSRHARKLPMAVIRRWQTAAAAGNALCVVFLADAGYGLPNAHVRLQVDAHHVHVLKARGTHARPSIALP